MNRISVIFIVLCTLISARVQAADASCSYKLVDGSVHVLWQAYKTTKKVGVHGEFKKFDLHNPSIANTIADMLKESRIVIDAASVDSGNPERDTTLLKFFFGLFKSPKITAQVAALHGADTGTLDMVLNLNGRTRKVPMTYETVPQGDFTAKGSIDILDFGLKPALSSLHTACIDRHKGEDGVSKTWSEVDLKVTAKVDRVCQ